MASCKMHSFSEVHQQNRLLKPRARAHTYGEEYQPSRP